MPTRQLYIDLTRLNPEYAGGATRFALGLTGALSEGIILATRKNSDFLKSLFPNRPQHMFPEPRGVVIHPLCTLRNWGEGVKSILCIHDIQHEVHPENFSLPRRLWRKYQYRRSAKAAWKIQVSSYGIWRDLTKYIGVPSGKLFLAPEGYDEKLWSPELPDEIPLNGVDFPKHFVYYPAGMWKHKNHETVIKGLSGAGISLVLTGKDYGELENIGNVAGRYGVKLWTLGIIPEYKMRWLYKNAICTIAAGYYESGSLPLKEALACGGKVLAANIEPNMELLGLKNLWHFEVFSPTSFSDQLADIVSGTERKGWKCLEDYRWSHIANIYRGIING